MSKIQTVALYARVSQETQNRDDSASIGQQFAEMRARCAANGWQIAQEFEDSQNYKATQAPDKGKMVNPSGERADRPELLKMLEAIRTGEIDFVMCWRDDRLVRHPRVAVALEDALDAGDSKRNGRGKIQIFDATGAAIDRFTLSIKATIWREENKRRAERSKMGKIGTLQQGRWPGYLDAMGYQIFDDLGKRGKRIEVIESEAAWVRQICEWFDAGVSMLEIRRRLIAEGVPQSDKQAEIRRHDWANSIIYNIVHNEIYTGKLTWTFSDVQYTIDIPAIIPRDLWERNRKRIERNKTLSTRNAGDVYMLQNILFCGDCGRAMQAKGRKHYWQNGEKRERKSQDCIYSCRTPVIFSDEPHPKPYNWGGKRLDWEVWRYIVDNGIKHPELIREQILNRQAELQAQGENFDSDIAHAAQRLVEIDEERASYQRQHARRKISEAEFDARIDETEESQDYWRAELTRLKDLRDNAERVQNGLAYATELLTGLQVELPKIDIPYSELKRLPKEERREILERRQKITRALCDRVIVFHNGHVVIEGLLDGSEASQFELATRWIDLLNLPIRFEFNLASAFFAQVGAAQVVE